MYTRAAKKLVGMTSSLDLRNRNHNMKALDKGMLWEVFPIEIIWL